MVMYNAVLPMHLVQELNVGTVVYESFNHFKYLSLVSFIVSVFLVQKLP